MYVMQRFGPEAEGRDYEDRDTPLEYHMQDPEDRAERMFRKQPLLVSYYKQRHDMNLNNKELGEILEHPWFQELYDSWEDIDKMSICWRMCGVDK